MIIPSTDLSKYNLTDDTSAISPAYAAGLIRALLANGTAQGTLDGFDLSDTTSAVTPKYAARAIRALMQQDVPQQTSLVIGVCDDGTRSAHGWGLKWIDKDFNTIENLPSDYFDNHPSWNFSEVIDNQGNYFRKIPIAYTKRGYVPYGENVGKWYMMLSPVPVDDDEAFTPHIAAFQYEGELRDSFLWSTYRASIDGDKLRSDPTLTPLQRTFITTLESYASNCGSGYHTGSVQEWHEILSRAVIEKKTFDLYPQNIQENREENIYRGIYDMNFVDVNNQLSEYRSGLRLVNANTRYLEGITESMGDYEPIVMTYDLSSRSIIDMIYSDNNERLDHLFIAQHGTEIIEACMIPSLVTVIPNGAICVFNVNPTQGVFSQSYTYTAETYVYQTTCRLAYIDPDSVYEP